MIRPFDLGGLFCLFGIRSMAMMLVKGCFEVNRNALHVTSGACSHVHAELQGPHCVLCIAQEWVGFVLMLPPLTTAVDYAWWLHPS
jgi:hypothetical protein